MSKRLVRFMVTAFRDGFQSAYGARVFTKDFLPAVEAVRDAGIDHFEAGGGARFQSLYFYCNEDAFAMMDAFRETTGPEANLQTLARGINVVGLDSQSRDVIDLHARLFRKHGITTIRNFDALNDVNNLIYSGQCIADAGLRHEVCVTMMELPPGSTGAHTPEFYMEVLGRILEAEIPYDSVCFKDASGTSTPAKVYETIKQARRALPTDTRIVFHSHETAGMSVYAYKAALEAGADQIDLSLAPVSGGTCQPDLVTMWHALRGTEFDLGIDIHKVLEAENVFKDCMADYFLPPEAGKVEPLIPFSPMPGGALTANTQMMRDNGILDRFNQVIDAMGEVVVRGGFGTSVTPVSQFYFQQAFNNVMLGPWKRIAEGYGKMVLGYFGATPVDPDPQIVALSQQQLGLEPTTRSPLDINDEDPTKGLEAARKMLRFEGLEETEENLFIAATCKDKGIAFLKGEATVGVRKKKQSRTEAEAPPGYTVTVGGTTYTVVIEKDHAIVDGERFDIDVRPGMDQPPEADAKTRAGAAEAKPLHAPLPGAVVRIHARPGAMVKPGETVLVLEAMKMETVVNAPFGGEVVEIKVSEGDQVTAGQILALIR